MYNRALVRIFTFQNITGRFGTFFYENRTVRCGAVRVSLFLESYGAVRWGFSPLRCDAVRMTFFEDLAVRCGTVRLSAEQLFPTVWLSVNRIS